jgi:hypothetical protein
VFSDLWSRCQLLAIGARLTTPRAHQVISWCRSTPWTSTSSGRGPRLPRPPKERWWHAVELQGQVDDELQAIATLDPHRRHHRLGATHICSRDVRPTRGRRHHHHAPLRSCHDDGAHAKAPHHRHAAHAAHRGGGHQDGRRPSMACRRSGWSCSGPCPWGRTS